MSNWLTFSDLYTEVAGLVDVGTSNATMVAFIKKVVNQAYRQIRKADPKRPLWFTLKRGSFSLTADTRSYTDQEAIGATAQGALAAAGITDLSRVVSMSVGGYPCKQVTPQTVEANAYTFWDDNNKEDYPQNYILEVSPFTSSVSGASTRTRSILNTITFFLMPRSTQTVRLFYETRVADLSADTDLPQMPPEYHQGIIYGALAILDTFGFDVSRVSNWAQMYRTIVQDMLTVNRELLNLDELNGSDPIDAWARL
jgi:hypothetical protein